MAENNRVSEFMERNKSSLASHRPIPLLKDSLFKNGPDPRGNIVLVNCFDVRVQPTQYFGLEVGEVNILNNAGGRIDDDAIRSIIVLDSIATVGTVIVVHHTDCGLTHSGDAQIKEKLKAKAPDNSQEIDQMRFGEISDVPQSVADDVKILKASPYLKHLKVFGFVFDITKGSVDEVKVE